VFLNGDSKEDLFTRRLEGFKGKNIRCASCIKPCMGFTKHLKFGTKNLINTCKVKGWLNMKQIIVLVYYLFEKGKLIIMVFYMDDLLIMKDHVEKTRWLKKSQLLSMFEMIKFELLKFLLGMEFLLVLTSIFMCQCSYIAKFLD
jgi:hypothetical protein